MKKIRFIFALVMAKLAIIALKITHHNGTNFPGIVALRICPDFLAYVNQPQKMIAVTGTNGKTTVSNLINDALKADGLVVLNNSLGSNINTGIATSLIYGVNIFNKEKYKIGVFEVDERSAPRIFPYLHFDYMIITNLSRDSIMRNAHPEYIRSLLEKYVSKDTKLILNADDLLSALILPSNDRVYFGIEKMASDLKESHNLINDIRVCPHCHHELAYEYVRYSNIGKAYCPHCEFKAPSYDYALGSVDTDKMTAVFKGPDGNHQYRLLNPSVFNIYNELILLTILSELGYSMTRREELLNKIDIVRSRFNFETVKGVEVVMLLAKDRNAYACSRVFEYIATSDRKKEIIMMMSSISDSKHWSENICWLYDADFEILLDKQVERIIATGPRGKDYTLRLALAGFDVSKIKTGAIDEAADKLLLNSDSTVYILYGTDSIGEALKVKNKIIDRLKEEKQ